MNKLIFFDFYNIMFVKDFNNIKIEKMKLNYLKFYGISFLGNYYNFVGILIVNKNRFCIFYL